MAHFAELNDNNVILRIVVVDNKIITPSEQALEIEQLGINFLKELFGSKIEWKQTSYNTSKGQHAHGKTQNRKNYAGIGYKYDRSRNAFIAPSLYLSWVLDENTCVYEAPVSYPDDGEDYIWDEDTLSWIRIDNLNM